MRGFNHLDTWIESESCYGCLKSQGVAIDQEKLS